MDEKNNSITTLGILLFGIVIGYSWGYGSNTEAETAWGQCEVVRDDYNYALERALESIREANSQIENAQSEAGSSYEDMEYTLEDLQEVYEPDDPGTICY